MERNRQSDAPRRAAVTSNRSARRPGICLKDNRVERTARCGLCGAETRARLGWTAFVDGTWDPVCDACVSSLSDRFAAALALARAADAMPPPGESVATWRGVEPELRGRDERGVELTVHHYNRAKRPWVARLTGRHPERKYRREFLDLEPVKTGASGQYGDYVARVSLPGVYQVGEAAKQTGFWLCAPDGADGALAMGRVGEERAAEIVDLLEAGTPVEVALRRAGRRAPARERRTPERRHR